MNKKQTKKQTKKKPKGVGRNGNLIPAIKGQPTRNPNGRPKKAETYSDILKELLSGQKIDVEWSVNGRKKNLTVTSTKNMYYGIAASQIMEALKGNVQAQREIVNRVQGKAVVSIAASIEGLEVVVDNEVNNDNGKI